MSGPARAADALLECVPNLSTADPAIVAAAVERLAAAEVVVLDHSCDADHGRAVVTFVGEASRVVTAAVDLAEFARDRLDITGHRGVHRRVGVLDVCPFVPLSADRMPRAVAAARAAADGIAALGIPVYLYAEAREREPRRVLGNVRNLGFEVLRERIGVEPDLAPDRGPRRMHPTAGAACVGARPFLIAWNVELEPPADLALARAIARRIRESSGGLPGVQAMGFWLERAGVAQVSCNLLDAGRAAGGLPAVFDAIAAEARAAGAVVRRSELIGLAPRAALDARIAEHVRLADFDEARCTVEGVLEARASSQGG